jgi:NAD(P)H-hydrate epimerase
MNSLIVGPGWGLSPTNAEFLEALLEHIPQKVPTVIDADGLKLLKSIDRWWEKLPDQTILTPHPGEMAVLTGLEVKEIQSDRWEIAKKYAKCWGVTLVLKGAETVIADPEGDLWINPISEPALATAGSGDVLSGMIGGFLAQGESALDAAVISAWLHAQAGILAKKKLRTDRSVTAVDILDSIPESLSIIS